MGLVDVKFTAWCPACDCTLQQCIGMLLLWWKLLICQSLHGRCSTCCAACGVTWVCLCLVTMGWCRYCGVHLSGRRFFESLYSLYVYLRMFNS